MTERPGVVPCCATPHCAYVGGCENCRPDQWRAIQVSYGAHRGTWHGQSFEHSRKSLRDLTEYFHNVASELLDAHAEGFRLYDIADNGVIHLCKGRVKR